MADTEREDEKKDGKTGLSDDQISAIVARELRLANGSERSEVSEQRTLALEYFEGEMNDYAPEPNHSSVVSKDVNDAIGWILPSLMDVFAASEDTALVQPVGPEDVQFAEDATLALNYVFWKKNDGYNVFYSGCHDALLLKDAIVKVWHEKADKSEVTTHSGLSDDQLQLLLLDNMGQQAEVEVLAHSVDEDGTHKLKLKREEYDNCYHVEVIPPEDFYIDPDAKSIAEARFVAHRSSKTRSDLIEMGFDKEKVNKIAVASDAESPEAVSRGDGRDSGEDDAPDTSTELVDYFECQFLCDVDGDGIAEMVLGRYGGKQGAGVLLEWEVWDEEPLFYSIPCKKIPHRFDSQSIADDTIEGQRVKTVLTRQALDNIYATNMPQKEVEADSVLNMDELTAPTFGGVVLKKKGSNPIVPLVTPFVANHAFEAITYQDEVIARRTGINRQSMALDGDALQNQSATANNNSKDAGYTKIKLLARNMAEFGWCKVFRALLRLMIKHQSKPMQVRLSNDEWRTIDPRPWNMDMDVQIDVGLGTGSRERDMMMLQMIVGNQTAAAQQLAGAGLVDQAAKFIPYTMETMKKMVKVSGLKAADQYYPEITEEEITQAMQAIKEQQGQMDPKAQAEIQMKAQEMQANAQNKQAEMQLKAQMGMQEMQLKREQLAAEIQLKREQLQAELQLKREQMAAELQLKAQLGSMNAQAKVNASVASSVHVGGEPG